MDEIERTTLEEKESENAIPLATIKDEGGATLSIYQDTVLFHPPLYKQRYEKVKEIIQRVSQGVLRKLADFGSSEYGFFKYLLGIQGLQEIIFMDIDIDVMKGNLWQVYPDANPCIMLSEPLMVRTVCGDACKCHSVLSGVQVITMIELIEHMQENDLPGLVRNVFHNLQPKLVIVTTPNADFNKYIPGFSPKMFRHWDHKFEWTQEQFQKWCREIVEQEGNYSLEFCGCGLGPDSTYCTQMAVFVHSSIHQDLDIDVSSFNSVTNSVALAPNIQETAIVGNSQLKSRFCYCKTTGCCSVLAEIKFPHCTWTQDELDRSHIFIRFDLLQSYLNGGAECVNFSGELSKVSDASWCEGSITFQNQASTSTIETHYDCKPSGEDFHENILGFPVYHTKHENEIDQIDVIDDKYPFYILRDEQCSLIPIKSLIAWIQVGADHKISTDLIRSTLEEDFVETSGDEDEWRGKLKLCMGSETEDSVEEIGSDNIEEEEATQDYTEVQWEGEVTADTEKCNYENNLSYMNFSNRNEKEWNWSEHEYSSDEAWE